MTLRCDGFVTVIVVVTVMSPFADGGLRVQVIDDVTVAVRGEAGSHVLLKLTLGVAPFETSQLYAEPCVAPIVFSSFCGRISLTGIDTSFAPMPAVPKVWFVRLVCSDEPGYRCEPRASRAYQSNTHLAPAFWKIVSLR